jgi:asparagine synthetase B (glutamine-hydrolysing)
MTETLSDAELITYLYARRGMAGIKHLEGAFTLAVWDDKEHQLICARDHFGLRPLYYYVSGRLFAFGSRIPPLFWELFREMGELSVWLPISEGDWWSPANPTPTVWK